MKVMRLQKGKDAPKNQQLKKMKSDIKKLEKEDQIKLE